MATYGKLKILFAGGGTGGHLFPAIALAQAAEKAFPGVQVVFVGAPQGLEAKKIPELGWRLHLVPIRGLSRTRPFSNLVFPFSVVRSLVQANRVLSLEQPDLVVGSGGYVAWPVLRAAVAKSIPTLIQEQNSYPGIVTRRLASKVNAVCLAYAEAAAYLKRQDNITVTGNPVRPDIASGKREEAVKVFGLDPAKKTVLVIGGSQGAASINRALLGSFDQFEAESPVQLIWQTGRGMFEEVSRTVAGRKVIAGIFPFIDQMPLAYAAADLVVCRSGALTLAELAVCGKPAILIPYPHAAADHQRHNAQVVQKEGAAEMILDFELEKISLGERIMSLLHDDGRLKRMAEKSRALARPDAATTIVGLMDRLLAKAPQANPVARTRTEMQNLPSIALESPALKLGITLFRR